MTTAATAFGSDAETEKLVAVKEFRRRASHTSWTAYSDLVRREFYLSKGLEHPNVIRTLQLYQGASQELYQVMEYCEAGDLFALVYSSRRGLHVEEADCFFKQLMCGVHYLHQNGIAHCDLKPENLLLTRQGCVKIADFGCAKDVRPATEDDDQEEETVLLVTGMCGSLPYISPEQHTKSSFDGQAADVWACGVIYLFVRFGTYLWGSATPDDDEYLAYSEGRRAEAGYRPLEMLEPPGCRNIVYCLLDPVPERRITAKQMLRSEWCSSIQVCNAGKGK